MNYPREKESTPEVNEPDLSGSYTAKDYITWQVDELMELIHGKIFKMSPGPRLTHQIVLEELHGQFSRSTERRKGCQMLFAPADVYLIRSGEDWKRTRNIVQPDLFIVCDPSKIHDRGCLGAPDFVVEVLSPSTSKKDASLKMELYEEYSVREYWMISIENRMVIANLLNEKGKYETQRPAVEGQVISPRDFPELKIDLEELFKGLPEDD